MQKFSFKLSHVQTLHTRTYLTFLVGHLRDLTKHDGGVTVQKCDTGQTLALLEGVDNHRVNRFKDALGDFVGFQGGRTFELFAASFLTNLEVQRRHLARRAAASDETDRGVASLQFTRDVQSLDLRGELLARRQGLVSLVHHDVARSRHVQFVETLDVHTNVVARVGTFDTLVVHFDGENLTTARVGGGVGRQEDNFLPRLDNALFDAAGEDIPDTLDLVNTRNRQSHRQFRVTFRSVDHVVQHVQQAVDVELFPFAVEAFDVDAVPPAHVGGLLDQVVTHPARDRQDRDRLGDIVRLPPDLGQHVAHFVADFGVPRLLVAGGIAIHLVDANDQLLDAQQVEQTRVLTRLALDFTSLVVTLLDGGGKVTIGRDHQQGDIGLRGTRDHVLDKISVTRRVDDGVVPLLSEKLLGRARDGHTTLALFLLAIHIERKRERRLTQGISLGFQLFDFTFRDTAEFKQQTTGGRGLAGIDVTADNDGEMLFAFRHC